MRNWRLSIRTMSPCTMHGIADLSNSRSPITNYWVMVLASFSRRIKMARRILTLKRYNTQSRVRWFERFNICYPGHQSPDRGAHVSVESSCSWSSLTVHRTSWYKPGQTPGSVLGEVSSSMEECRAETVALYRKCRTLLLASLFWQEAKWLATLIFSRYSA